MRIVTTPMCEEVVRLAGINDYKVNKNPDLEDGDLAILLSESKVEMNSLAIKLNTPSQLFESIKEVSKLKNELSDAEILEFFKNYNLCVKYLENHENSHVKVKVYSNFLNLIYINFSKMEYRASILSKGFLDTTVCDGISTSWEVSSFTLSAK